MEIQKPSRKIRKFSPMFKTAVFLENSQTKTWGCFDDSRTITITKPIDSMLIWAASAGESTSEKILKRTLKRRGWQG